MSTKDILAEIRALPPEKFQTLWQQVQRWMSAGREATSVEDPIRSARDMLAGTRLNQGLLASRAGERRRD